MNITDLANTYSDAFAAALSAPDDAHADAADARGWDAFDRAVAAPATTRADQRAKVELARAMIGRECPEQAARLLASLARDLADT